MIDLPAFIDGPPIVVSATQYVTYLTCPEQSLQRTLGVYGEDSKQSLRGMLAHRLFYRHLTTGPIDAASLEDVCRAEIGERYNNKLPGLGLARISTLRPLIQEVGAIYDKFKDVETTGFVRAEVDLRHELPGQVTLRGTIDAVFVAETGGMRLIDWKTGRLGEVAAQLDFYSLLWTLVHDELPSTVEASSVATGDRYVARPTTEETRSTIAAIARLVNATRTALNEEGSLARTAGPHCQWCPVLADCREGSAAMIVNR